MAQVNTRRRGYVWWIHRRNRCMLQTEVSAWALGSRKHLEIFESRLPHAERFAEERRSEGREWEQGPRLEGLAQKAREAILCSEVGKKGARVREDSGSSQDFGRWSFRVPAVANLSKTRHCFENKGWKLVKSEGWGFELLAEILEGSWCKK